MSTGWSPTATLVSPGKSMRVMFRTWGEYTRRLIGRLEMPLLEPVTLFDEKKEQIEKKAWVLLCHAMHLHLTLKNLTFALDVATIHKVQNTRFG